MREYFGVCQGNDWLQPEKGLSFMRNDRLSASLTTALGFSVLSFHPFTPSSTWLDFWDFLVSTNILPLGAMIIALFCTSRRFGWGWEKFMAEANKGEGLKVKNWMRPIFAYVVPGCILVIYIVGMVTFEWR